MKVIGTFRRIDDLGRVVIPKEIRTRFRMREGDPLEIFTGKEGEIILKKTSPFGELHTFAKEYAQSLSKTMGHIVCIVDKERVIAMSGWKKAVFMGKGISHALEKAIYERTVVMADRSDMGFVQILRDEPEELYSSELIVPIIAQGYPVGAIVFLSLHDKIDAIEHILAQAAADFIGKQMEQ